MKGISLWQPWASLWCSPRKVHETRHWPTSHRGWLLVHAAKRKPDIFDGDDLDQMVAADFPAGIFGLPRGALIGAVKVIACKRTEEMPGGFEATDDYVCGDFSFGRYAWERGGFYLFKDPIPYRGMQGIFSVLDSVLPNHFLQVIKEAA
jgi:hypothetical protein